MKNFPEPSCQDGAIRLSPDGPSSRQGRVEVCYENLWGAVYDERWSEYDAAVACAQLGFDRNGQCSYIVMMEMCELIIGITIFGMPYMLYLKIVDRS